MTDDDVKRVAAHLRRALHTYVEGDDTRATELTDDELCDIARAAMAETLRIAAERLVETGASYGPNAARWLQQRAKEVSDDA